MNETSFLGQVYAFIFANYLVILTAVLAVIGVGILIAVLLYHPKKKEARAPVITETQYAPGISFGTPANAAAQVTDDDKDKEPNTVTLDETAGKTAVFSYVDYKGNLPPFPRLPLPDGNDYWIFIKRKTDPEHPFGLILPVNVAHTPEKLSDADNDVDTPALLALLQEGKSIWEKAIIGELALLVIALIIYSLCVM